MTPDIRATDPTGLCTSGAFPATSRVEGSFLVPAGPVRTEQGTVSDQVESETVKRYPL